MILGLSLCLSNISKVVTKGTPFFKKKLQEYFQRNKAQPLPGYFVKHALGFLRNNKEFEGC